MSLFVVVFVLFTSQFRSGEFLPSSPLNAQTNGVEGENMLYAFRVDMPR